MKKDRGNLKMWAKDHLKGIENTLFPSFTPDMKNLDEKGIRHDVRESIKHGFFSTMCATETGLTVDEAKQFIEIVNDEARGKIGVTTSLILDTFEDNMELLQHATKIGLEGVLLGYPPNFQPKSEQDILDETKRFCDATDLHVTIYPSPHFNFDHFHPSGFPVKILEDIAKIDNVIAMKVGEIGLFAHAHNLIGDEVLIGCPVERYVPTLVLGYGMQWMGAGCYEVLQSPEKPYVVNYFNLLQEGKVDEAMEIYWMLSPARNIFEDQFNKTVMLGTYNWHQQKYYQWCVGGNGGLTRQPAMKIHSFETQATDMAFRMIGINPDTNKESFVCGRSNYNGDNQNNTNQPTGSDFDSVPEHIKKKFAK